MEKITAPELKKLLEKGKVILVDIRNPKQFKKEHIPNAINIDFYDEDFEENWNQLPTDKQFVLCCNHGEKSELALTFLASIDATPVRHLEGGIEAWEKNGYDLET
jgi:phage shock protein E